MHRMLGGRVLRLVLVAGALLVGAAAAGYATSALTAPATTVIQACRNTESGLLRMISNAPLPSQHGEEARYATRCRPSEVAVSWNVQGPKGDPGPQGPTGAQGPKGDPGAGGAGAASLDALNGTPCSLDFPGAPAPVPGTLSVTWSITGSGSSLSGYSGVPSFACKPTVAPPPPAVCPPVPNGTATCANNDGVVTSVVCDSGFYQPAGRDPALGCAPNSRTNATQATAVDLGTVTCGGPALPSFGDSIAGPGDEAWYLVHLSISSGCPSQAGVTWSNPGGTLAYDVYGQLGGAAVAMVTNWMADYGPAPIGFPPAFTGTIGVYLRVHEAPAATAGGSFTASLLAQ